MRASALLLLIAHDRMAHAQPGASGHSGPSSPPVMASWPSARTVFAFGDARDLVAVQRLPGMPMPYAIDFATGRAGALVAGVGDSLVMMYIEGGERANAPGRVLLELGASPSIRLPGITASRELHELAIAEEEISVRNGDVMLAGRFIRPARAGRHPLVVFLHGSGPSGRGTFLSWGALLAANGIASIAYDKRGTGASTGDFRSARFSDLAEDARAIVGAARARADVDADRIALVGTSQGPWLATMIAADDPRIAAVVFSSGGGIAPLEQEGFRRVRAVEEAGATPAEVAAARDLVTRYLSFYSSFGRDSAGLGAPLSRWGAAWWFPKLEVGATLRSRDRWSPQLVAFASDLALDLAPLHRRMHQPVLQLLADGDHNVPAARAAEVLRAELPEGRHGQLTQRVLPGADHRMQIAAAAGDMPRFHPGFFSEMVTWLRLTLRVTP